MKKRFKRKFTKIHEQTFENEKKYIFKIFQHCKRSNWPNWPNDKLINYKLKAKFDLRIWLYKRPNVNSVKKPDVYEEQPKTMERSEKIDFKIRLFSYCTS